MSNRSPVTHAIKEKMCIRDRDIATSVVSGVANTIIGLVFAIYILLQKENLGRQFRRLFYALFPEKHVDRFLEVCDLTSASFNSFLSGQCLEAFILGMMFFISMSLLKMPYALVIALLIGCLLYTSTC